MSVVLYLDKFRLAALIFTAFIAIGALWGAIMFWLSPSGTLWSMETMLAVMQRELPFSDLFFRDLILSGVALLLIIGVPHGLTFVAFYRRKSNAAILLLLAGVILMLWISVQFVIFEFNILSTAYFVFGLIEVFASVCYLAATRKP